MDNLTNLVITQLAETIEPLTCYDRSSLELISGETRITSGRFYSRYVVRITNTRENSTGHLPYVNQRLESSDQLDRVAAATEESARHALQQRMQSWANAHSNSDRSLSDSDCFDGPKIFGHEWACSDCGGVGKQRCQHCDMGYNKCGNCSNGRVDCSKSKSFIREIAGMRSKGKITCPTCKGKGKTPDGNRCGSCRGSGETVCRKCGGARTVDCSDCRGQGKIPCKYCNATGYITCAPCKGTGYFHSTRKVECSVSHDDRVQLASEPNSEVSAKLISCDLSALRSLARVKQNPVAIADYSAQREYDLDCVITEVMVRVAPEALQIVGYGTKAAISDYKDIVARILANDLAALKTAVENTPMRLSGPNPNLTKATRDFIESEVNVELHEDGKRDKHLNSRTVNQAYIDQAKAHLRSGLLRLHFALMGPALAVTAIAPTAVFVAGHFMGLWHAIGGWASLIVVSSGIVPLIAFEQKARNRLIADLHTQTSMTSKPGDKLNLLLSKHYVLWRFRALAVAVAAILLAIAVALVDQLAA